MNEKKEALEEYLNEEVSEIENSWYDEFSSESGDHYLVFDEDELISEMRGDVFSCDDIDFTYISEDDIINFLDENGDMEALLDDESDEDDHEFLAEVREIAEDSVGEAFLKWASNALQFQGLESTFNDWRGSLYNMTDFFDWVIENKGIEAITKLSSYEKLSDDYYAIECE